MAGERHGRGMGTACCVCESALILHRWQQQRRRAWGQEKVARFAPLSEKRGSCLDMIVCGNLIASPAAVEEVSLSSVPCPWYERSAYTKTRVFPRLAP